MANTTNLTSENNRVFSRRHLRGWIVAALLAALLILDTAWLLGTIFMGASGHSGHLQVDIPFRLFAINVVLAGAAILTASPRARGFTVKVGEAIGVRVALLFRRGHRNGPRPLNANDQPIRGASEVEAVIVLDIEPPVDEAAGDAA